MNRSVLFWIIALGFCISTSSFAQILDDDYPLEPETAISYDDNTTPDDHEELFDEMFNTFKKYGKNKAQYYEGYYQSYFGTTYMNYLEAIEKSAQKYNLTKTGGLDSHGPNIITRHPFI